MTEPVAVYCNGYGDGLIVDAEDEDTVKVVLVVISSPDYAEAAVSVTANDEEIASGELNESGVYVGEAALSPDEYVIAAAVTEATDGEVLSDNDVQLTVEGNEPEPDPEPEVKRRSRRFE